MRWTASILVVLLLPAVARAEPPLLGRSADGRYRIVDKNLQPKQGRLRRLRLPAATHQTLLSPNHRRFVAVGHRRRPVLYNRRTGRRLRRLPPVAGGYGLRWVGNRYLVADGYYPPTREDGLQFLDLRTNKVRTRSSSDAIGEIQLAGRHVRILVLKNRLRRERGLTAEVRVFARNGRRLDTIPVPLPPGAASDPDYYPELRGRTVLHTVYDRAQGAQGAPSFWLAHLGGRPHRTDLRGDNYQWLSDTVLSGEAGRIALIDPATLAVRKRSVLPAGGLTPVRDGFMVGLGRQVYNERLRLVADNPGAPTPQSLVVRHGRRLYARTYTCDADTENFVANGAVIVNACTGVVLKRLKGRYAFGRLGGPTTDPRPLDCLGDG